MRSPLSSPAFGAASSFLQPAFCSRESAARGEADASPLPQPAIPGRADASPSAPDPVIRLTRASPRRVFIDHLSGFLSADARKPSETSSLARRAYPALSGWLASP